MSSLHFTGDRVVRIEDHLAPDGGAGDPTAERTQTLVKVPKRRRPRRIPGTGLPRTSSRRTSDSVSDDPAAGDAPPVKEAEENTDTAPPGGVDTEACIRANSHGHHRSRPRIFAAHTARTPRQGAGERCTRQGALTRSPVTRLRTKRGDVGDSSRRRSFIPARHAASPSIRSHPTRTACTQAARFLRIDPAAGRSTSIRSPSDTGAAGSTRRPNTANPSRVSRSSGTSRKQSRAFDAVAARSSRGAPRSRSAPPVPGPRRPSSTRTPFTSIHRPGRRAG